MIGPIVLPRTIESSMRITLLPFTLPDNAPKIVTIDYFSILLMRIIVLTEFLCNAELSQPVAGLDEGSANVSVLAQHFRKGNTTLQK